MIDIGLTDRARDLLAEAKGHAASWSARHQWQMGVAEMALGAATVVWAVQSGGVQLGTDLVASAMGYPNAASVIGGGGGIGIGAFAGSMIGSIGVCGMGSAIAVPALLLSCGAALVFGAAGYTTGDLLNNFLHASDLERFATDASLLTVGIALLIDGARRVATDKTILAACSYVRDGVLHLCALGTAVVAETLPELKAWAAEVLALPDTPMDAAGSAAAGGVGLAAGIAAGSSLAAGSVTVLGSSTLGSVALSLGLVSAPVWPVVAAGAIGLGTGYAVWKLARYYGGGSAGGKTSDAPSSS